MNHNMFYAAAILSMLLAVALIFISENPTGALSAKTDNLNKPDLMLISFGASKPNPLSTDTVAIVARVKNRGMTSAGESILEITDKYNKEIIRRWNLEIPSLEPSEVYTTKVSTSFIKGTHILIAVPDVNDRIDEIEEKNQASYVIISK